ncbi:MAG: hypothetical protein IKF42_01575 [Mogibacterium sp.]|nr:hypothetical protein [Mogibacterium sp.]
MGKRSFRRVMALMLVMLMTAGTFMLTGCGKSYEYIFGDVEWLSTYKEKSSDTDTKTIKDTFYYSNDWFSDNPSSENKELALASMQLIASCVNDDADGTGAAFLRNMGFEEVGFSDFASDDPGDCNYTWARRSVGDSTLVAVVMQSVNRDWKLRNKAWKQNFTVNEPGNPDPSGEHYAYAEAADKIVDDVTALAGEGPATFWIMGQSRGGAIANVLAVRLQEKLDKAKIFAYTFESPATVDANDAGSYKNIHNYICSDDIVTHIPMWGMTRYGVMHDLKTKETDGKLAETLEALGSDAAGMKARIVTDDVVARLSENLGTMVSSRAEYSTERTDSWTDSEGKSHELTYSCQDAFVKLMDLVFNENSSGSLFERLASKKGDLEGSIGHLVEGVKAGAAGKDPSAEYWEAATAMYAVLNDTDGGLPISEEDLYEVLRFAAPALITVPEDGGEPDAELLTDVIGYNRELIYSHQFDTIIARLKILAPAPKK